MLRTVKQLERLTLHARDGVIGDIKDVYFDDHHWYVRYIVIETGEWLNKRRVLIAPEAVHPAEWDRKVLATDLTQEQVRQSPGVDTDKPVSRQYETSLRQHYGWPAYWETVMGPDGLASPILAPTPAANTSEPGLTDGDAPLVRRGDPHLRSTNDTLRHRIEALDGSIGHVNDFLVDEKSWRIRYLVIDTRNWWPGKKVLVAPDWIKNVNWSDKSVTVNLTRDAIKRSPPYDAAAPWNPEYAAELHDYYGRPRYSDWDQDVVAGAPKLDRKR